MVSEVVEETKNAVVNLERETTLYVKEVVKDLDEKPSIQSSCTNYNIFI